MEELTSNKVSEKETPASNPTPEVQRTVTEKNKTASERRKRIKPKTLAMMGLFTAIVFVLQLLGSQIRFGIFSISTVLIPIVIGGALYGVSAGIWLGLVFAAAVFISGDANFFLGINVGGTIVTVVAKGLACGAVSALLYRLIAGSTNAGNRANVNAGSNNAAAGQTGTAVNGNNAAGKTGTAVNGNNAAGKTGSISAYRMRSNIAAIVAAVACPIVNTGVFILGCSVFFLNLYGSVRGIITACVGINFIIELIINVVLSPVIIYLIKYQKRIH